MQHVAFRHRIFSMARLRPGDPLSLRHPSHVKRPAFTQPLYHFLYQVVIYKLALARPYLDESTRVSEDCTDHRRHDVSLAFVKRTCAVVYYQHVTPINTKYAHPITSDTTILCKSSVTDHTPHHIGLGDELLRKAYRVITSGL